VESIVWTGSSLMTKLCIFATLSLLVTVQCPCWNTTDPTAIGIWKQHCTHIEFLWAMVPAKEFLNMSLLVPYVHTLISSLCSLQESSGYLFCLEDHALLCTDCGVAIHTLNSFVSVNQRFLLTGVQVGLGHAESSSYWSMLILFVDQWILNRAELGDQRGSAADVWGQGGDAAAEEREAERRRRGRRGAVASQRPPAGESWWIHGGGTGKGSVPAGAPIWRAPSRTFAKPDAVEQPGPRDCGANFLCVPPAAPPSRGPIRLCPSPSGRTKRNAWPNKKR
jgi:hypothetical protein